MNGKASTTSNGSNNSRNNLATTNTKSVSDVDSDEEFEDFDKDSDTMEYDDYDNEDDENNFGEESEEEEYNFEEELENRDDEDFYEDLTQVKKPKIYETSFKVLTATELHSEQKSKIDHVSPFLSVSESKAKTLLWSYKWQADSLIEAYIDDSAKIVESAGLCSADTTKPEYQLKNAPQDYSCFICCEGPDATRPNFLIFELECGRGHSLCVDCFRSYIYKKVSEEGESLGIMCPQYKCPLMVPEKAVEELFVGQKNATNLGKDAPEIDGDSTFTKYCSFLDKEYVQQNDKMTFCIAPSCEKIIELQSPLIDVNRKVPSVKCACGQAFCFACRLDDHMPATCTVAKAWLKKCQDDSETSNWIAANTQECNKCHSTIEKNGGCNHMTCKRCKHEFCWVCMGDWNLHGTSYYNCSRFDEADAQTARSEQDRSRAQLKRYLHYYNRYVNHQNSLKLDRETYEEMQKKMKQMQENAGMSWIEVQFLSQAFDVLSASRHTLTWTYAFAYYLQKTSRTIIFEDNQNDLEVAVEQLSELFEKPAKDLAQLKVKLLDKCQYVASRRVVLLEDVAQGLEEGIWNYVGLQPAR